jgi:hypothetical protein
MFVLHKLTELTSERTELLHVPSLKYVSLSNKNHPSTPRATPIEQGKTLTVAPVSSKPDVVTDCF